MEVFNNLNKNIFGDNNHAFSNTINFSSIRNDKTNNQNLETSSGKIPSYEDLKKEQNKLKVEEPKPFSSNNLIKINQKPKSKPVQDPLSYSNYSSSLKKITDPLSQMKPVSTFGYPSQKKATNKK